MRWMALGVLWLALAAPAQARMPRPPIVHVTVAECPQPGGGPCAATSTARIYLPHGTTRPGRSHEIGHLFAAQLLTDDHRGLFERLMGVHGSWDRGGYYSPMEWFADYYATCDLNLTPPMPWWSSYITPTPRYARWRRVCNAISVIGRIRGARVLRSRVRPEDAAR